MLFGSYGIAPGEIPDLERETSEKMQDMVLKFVIDGVEGMEEVGWPAYNTSAEDGGMLAQFSANGEAVRFVSGDSREGACYIEGQEYDSTP